MAFFITRIIANQGSVYSARRLAANAVYREEQ